jgi:hypothetical protein
VAITIPKYFNNEDMLMTVTSIMETWVKAALPALQIYETSNHQFELKNVFIMGRDKTQDKAEFSW